MECVRFMQQEPTIVHAALTRAHLRQAGARHCQLRIPLQEGEGGGVQAAHQLLHHPIQRLQVA